MVEKSYARRAKDKLTSDIGQQSRAGFASVRRDEDIPREARKELRGLVREIRRTDYLHPDSKPNGKWKVFYADNWEEARDRANEASYGRSNYVSMKGARTSTEIQERLKQRAKPSKEGEDQLEWHRIHRDSGLAASYKKLFKAMDAQIKREEGMFSPVDYVEDLTTGNLTLTFADSESKKIANLHRIVAENIGAIAGTAAKDGLRRADGDVYSGDIAKDAKRDASFFALALINRDGLDVRVIDSLNERMDAWRKGYAVCCDVDGTLYVYAKGKPPS